MVETTFCGKAKDECRTFTWDTARYALRQPTKMTDFDQ